MLSSSTTKGECTCSRNRKNLNNIHRGCSSPSPSTSKPSTSSFSLRNNKKAMEDVWKDINLASLSDQNSSQHPITTTTTNNNTQSANLQDFLARPLTSFSIAIDPVTALSLSTRPELTHKDLQLAQPHHNPPLKAYMFELKQKVRLLQEENARLRSQQQLLGESAANQRKKRGNLYRASTAPF